MVAIVNGIMYEYNNGLTEGSVRKVIKHIMCGKNSLELLKEKVLIYEDFRINIS